MTVKWIEPTSATDDTPIELSLSDAAAILRARVAFKQARPGKVDTRTDAECLEDFITVNWGYHEPEGTL